MTLDSKVASYFLLVASINQNVLLCYSSTSFLLGRLVLQAGSSLLDVSIAGQAVYLVGGMQEAFVYTPPLDAQLQPWGTKSLV